MPRKLTTEEWIERAISKHGDKYDYSQVQYVGSRTKVRIVCKNSHDYFQLPADHMRGVGCPGCRWKKEYYTVDQFIEKAIARHGDKFDYSKVEYTDSVTKVEIICKEADHLFCQTPSKHLYGRGCPECASTKKSSTKEFAAKAIARHGDKFDYSRVKYVSAHTKVEIVCSKHGHVFCQQPAEHLTGKGCIHCQKLYQRGEGGTNWNPNISDEDRKHRRSFQTLELNYWRGSVFGRDNSTCQCCRTKDKTINAHHILPWSRFPEVRFDVDNGITFCIFCHRKYHSAYKLAECNHKTIAEFLSLSETK